MYVESQSINNRVPHIHRVFNITKITMRILTHTCRTLYPYSVLRRTPYISYIRIPAGLTALTDSYITLSSFD